MKRHDFDPASFAFGVLFAALALFFLLGDRTVADLGARWIWPVAILVPGLVMVLYGVRGALRPPVEAADNPVEAPELPVETTSEPPEEEREAQGEHGSQL